MQGGLGSPLNCSVSKMARKDRPRSEAVYARTEYGHVCCSSENRLRIFIHKKGRLETMSDFGD